MYKGYEKDQNQRSNINRDTLNIKNIPVSEDFYNPYTFIPLSKKVFQLPKEEINILKNIQDIPVVDGLSGYIDVNFRAITPFCVRDNEGEKSVKMDSFFVPSTSLKGMVRNIFEIITLSNIKNGIADSRYSMRDLGSNFYKLKDSDHPQESGFLIQHKGNFWIIKCKSEKMSYEDIKEEEKVDIKNIRSIKAKYDAIKNHIITWEYKDGSESYSMWLFSGFMNGKKHEYQFDIPENIQESDLIPLKEKEFEDFIFIHQKENENLSWKYWKSKLKNYNSIEDIKNDKYKGIIPCFFRMKAHERAVENLGFSFLYRQPYKQSIHDCLPDSHKKETIDMSQSVFGFTSKGMSLKGRIQFSHAIINNAQLASRQTFILGSPKATYYPFYLEQKKNTKPLQNYFDTNISITGWKRYLLHQAPQNGIGGIKPKAESSFIPLKEGTIFSTTIRFHNLRPYELGALLYAISFCEQSSSCYFSLGYAKPFGYGKIKVEKIQLKLTDYTKPFTDKECIKMFKEKLTSVCNITESDWQSYLKPLLEIAKGEYKDKKIRYPNLNDKEFERIKKFKQNIENFSPIKNK